MRRLLLMMTLTACALLAAPGSASAAVCNFQGPGSLWHASANWDCLVIPDGDDTANIGAGDNVTVDQAESAAALNVDGGGQITFSGNPTLAVSGAASMTSGTLTGNGTVSVAATGTFTKSTGSGLLITNAADLVLNADGVHDGGAVCLQDGGGGDPNLVINGQYAITTGADTNAFNCNGGLDAPAVVINPGGLLTKDAAGLTQLLTPMDNDGQIMSDAGTLSLFGGQAGGVSSGLYATSAGATTNYGSVHTLGGTGVITGAGITMISSDVTVPAGAGFTPTTVTHTAGTLTLGGVAPTLAPTTYNLQGGTLQSTRPLAPTGALNVTSGVLQGNFNTTITGPTTFSKTTSGQLTVQNAADLILNVNASHDGGNICLQDVGGGDPSLQINAQLTVTQNSDINAFNCNGGLDTPAILISATGHLIKDGAASKQFLTPMDNDGLGSRGRRNTGYLVSEP